MTKFVIGIGSQRAGSTLLHKILNNCTKIFMHPVKELHYYDTLFNVRNPSVLKSYSNRQLDLMLEKVINSKQFNFIDKRFKCSLRTNKILSSQPIDLVDYLDLYRPCIRESEYLGEITPEYMILPEKGIKKMCEDIGEDAKIILIGRNPVDRFISAFKLLKMYNNPHYDMVNFQTDMESTMINMPTWIEQQDQLNDYEAALRKYRKYFKNVLFFTYENLVKNPERIRFSLEAFLEMKLDTNIYQQILSEKVNTIGETGVISEAMFAEFSKRYSNTLAFLNNYDVNDV